MNFKDPISTFAYNLISLHHDIMWYIIIILSLVYWSLYKIVKDYSWSNYNKAEGFLLALANNKTIFEAQVYILYIWLNIFKVIYKAFELIFRFIYSSLELKLVRRVTWLNTLFIKIYSFILGASFAREIKQNNDYEEELTLKYFKLLVLERHIASFLFSAPSNALYFYDGYDDYLLALKFKHSINLEYVFGMFPTIIISLIIVPSMYLLYSNETDVNPCITIKILGRQWYWTYEGHHWCLDTDLNKFMYWEYSYDSVIINEADLLKGQKRLLETDKSLVLPYNIVLRLLITSSDVLHAWSLPELGIKVDAVPGRLNQAITIPCNLGLYYGQCSELCGVSHGFMPIKVNVVTLTEYYSSIINKA
jgi:cytochrome c oxidase subunit 2